MRRKSATRFSGATLEMPAISRTLPRVRNTRKLAKSMVRERIAPPSEELVKRLNMIGREYPFCVNYKYGASDVL